jgi:DNA-binding MarR family transcriptional regulator
MAQTSHRRQQPHSEVVDGLMALSRAVVAITSRSLSEVAADVTLTQYRTLIVLASRGPQRIADLAMELDVQPSTATRLCDRLVGRGLASRQHGEADRRVVWVTLTSTGQRLVGQVMRKRRAMLARLLAGLTLEDPEAFARNAQRLAIAAGELSEREWWAQWERSPQPHLDPVPSPGVQR